MCVSLLDPDQIQITRLFPTPIASLRYPGFETLNTELKAIILARAEQCSGTLHSNQGGWQSSDDFPAWADEPGQRLLDFARELANQLSAVQSPEHGLVEARLAWTHNAWANINLHGHSNRLHGHPGAYWSAVYWVDAGDEHQGGELEFLDPRGLTPSLAHPHLRMRIEGCLDAGFMKNITPRAGTLLMFPSWLLHSVSPYLGQRPRISVAFNFSV
ncbi:TIGR02466 family protein [Pseudomonas sp. NPDC090202]|uniref:TIGR02466 family protein n=1 Tax=unclassified Pseudomonas TaxID=196821 RepID=UPI0037FC01FC